MYDVSRNGCLGWEIEELYETYRTRIYRTIRGIVLDAWAADDLTQRTFEKAFRARRRGRGHEQARLMLHRIAVKIAIAHTRRQSLARLLPPRLFAGAGQAAVDRVEVPTVAVRALRALSPKLRTVVVLHLYGEMTRAEIAEILRSRPVRVDTQLSAAMRVMQRALIPEERAPAIANE